MEMSFIVALSINSDWVAFIMPTVISELITEICWIYVRKYDLMRYIKEMTMKEITLFKE